MGRVPYPPLARKRGQVGTGEAAQTRSNTAPGSAAGSWTAREGTAQLQGNQ